MIHKNVKMVNFMLHVFFFFFTMIKQTPATPSRFPQLVWQLWYHLLSLKVSGWEGILSGARSPPALAVMWG